MLLKICLPNYENMIMTARIIKWHKQEGEAINFGEPLFDMAVDWAKFVHHTTDHWDLEIQVMASDIGTLCKVMVPEGQTAELGQIVAAVAPLKDAPNAFDEAELESAKPFRVITDKLDTDF